MYACVYVCYEGCPTLNDEGCPVRSRILMVQCHHPLRGEKSPSP